MRIYIAHTSQNKEIFSGSLSKLVRMYSTTKENDDSSTEDVCQRSSCFFDADKDKLEILKYVKGKSGIYM